MEARQNLADTVVPQTSRGTGGWNPAALFLPGVNSHCSYRIGGGYMPIDDFDFIFDNQ
jgi:hypothetical protein